MLKRILGGLLALFVVTAAHAQDYATSNANVNARGQVAMCYNGATAAACLSGPVSTSVLAANLVVKNTAGALSSLEVSADSTLSGAAWWVMVYDATAAPADGTVTPKKCFAQASGATSAAYTFPTPISFAAGIVIGVSTTGCFSKTASTHAFISGDAQ